MARERMTRRCFLAKAAAAAAGLAVLGLGVQCGGTPTPEPTEVVPTETPVVKETPAPEWKTPERILFIGNSLTYYNQGVETHVRSLAACADPPLAIETSSATAPGATLKDHYTGASLALEEIREGGWDVVVLQGWREALDTEEEFYEYARKLDEEIKKAGAHTVFFMIWGELQDPSRPLSMREETEAHARAYNKIGAELGARVAPVGLASQRSIEENPDLNLYAIGPLEVPDPIHSNMHGTYLAACVFYATLFGQSPVGLAYAPEEITEEERTFLQRMAWETVSEYEQP